MEQYEQPFFMDSENSNWQQNAGVNSADMANNQGMANDSEFSEQYEKAKAYASKISRNAKQDGFKPIALHCYTNKLGLPLYFKTRLKQPDTGYKWIRAMSLKPDGKNWQTKEPDFKAV